MNTNQDVYRTNPFWTAFDGRFDRLATSIPVLTPTNWLYQIESDNQYYSHDFNDDTSP